MRRIWATLLVAMFGFTLIGPVVLSTGGDRELPPCCRKDGKHHCGASQGESASGPTFGVARCPLYGGEQTLPPMSAAGMLKVSQAIVAAAASHRIRRPQTESLIHISFDRSLQKRGPPLLS